MDREEAEPRWHLAAAAAEAAVLTTNFSRETFAYLFSMKWKPTEKSGLPSIFGIIKEMCKKGCQ